MLFPSWSLHVFVTFSDTFVRSTLKPDVVIIPIAGHGAMDGEGATVLVLVLVPYSSKWSVRHQALINRTRIRTRHIRCSERLRGYRKATVPSNQTTLGPNAIIMSTVRASQVHPRTNSPGKGR